ncbi:MAG: PAS domain S-box protein [Chloroflexota bacterium]|nr:MAG: PAS domain S-box protein [Chloroflexota bacterium]
MQPDIETQHRLMQELASLRQRLADFEEALQPDGPAIESFKTDLVSNGAKRVSASIEQVFEAVAEGVVVADDRGRIVYMNGRAQSIFGYRRDELRGQPVEVLLPKGLQQTHQNHVQSFSLNPRTRPMSRGHDLTGRRKDGSETSLQIGLSTLDTEAGRLLVAIMTETQSEERFRPQEVEDTTLLRTKLYIPQVNDQLISRSRLIDRLNESLETSPGPNSVQTFNRALTLVSAPAGYGKTTLVSSWLRNVETPAAWVALDEQDNDLLVFFRYVIAAVRGLFPESCADTARLAQETRDVTPAYLANRLVNDLVAIPDSLLLVFDDFHLIRDRAIVSLAAQLINNQPPNLHLVVITRTDPSLPLARLRASGALTEIRAPELRFQDDEAERFIRQAIGFSVDRNSIIALNQKTEGWVVGLRLALLTIRGQRDITDLIERFQTRPNRFVSDYLMSEVLAQQPETIRALMVRSSILNRMSGPLIEALMDADDSDFQGQAFLDWLVSSNLFLIPIDDRGQWFRYHHLFQTMLEHNLRANYPRSEISTFYRLASRWFADSGLIEEAIRYALAGDDIDTAIKLVEGQSQNILNSQDRSTLERWLDDLPQDVIWQRPSLLITKAWLLYREWRLEVLDEILDAVEENLGNESSPEKVRPLEGQVAALRASTSYVLRGDHSLAFSYANRALELLPGIESGAHGAAASFRALAQQALGKRTDAVNFLERITRSPSRSDLSKIQHFIGLCLLHQMAGDLQAMSRVLDQFLNLSQRLQHPNSLAAANRFAAWLNYEWNDLNKAAEQCSTVIEYRHKSNFVSYFYAAMSLIRIHQLQGQLAEAQFRLEDLRAETLRLNHGLLMGPLEAFEASIWALYGDVHSALRWARSFDTQLFFDSAILMEATSLIHARVLILHGTRPELQIVRDRLHAQRTQAKADHFTQREISILVHLALAHERLGDREQALESTKQAVLLAQPGGFIRTFVDMGQPLRELLNVLSSRLPNDSQPYLAKLLTSFEETPYPRPSLQEPQRGEMESITKRELDVLKLMQAEKSDAEIASELVIALSTARKHASNIYRKLDANNRWQAIQKAEELGIL